MTEDNYEKSNLTTDELYYLRSLFEHIYQKMCEKEDSEDNYLCED